MILLLDKNDSAEDMMNIISREMDSNKKFFSAVMAEMTYRLAEEKPIEEKFKKLLQQTKDRIVESKGKGIRERMQFTVEAEGPRIYSVGFDKNCTEIVEVVRQSLKEYIIEEIAGSFGAIFKIRAASDTHLAGLFISVGLAL